MKLIPGRLLAVVSWLLLGIDPVSAADYSASAKVLYQFSMSDRKGFNAQGTLLRGSDGAFYGTTMSGGAHGYGTVFKFDAGGSNVTILHSFREARTPVSGLAEGKDGWLYGTTEAGGNRNMGTVFKLGKDGRGFTQLHEFNGVGDGGMKPQAGVTIDSEGALYGTTTEGGSYWGGILYRIAPDRKSRRALHSFGGKYRMDGSTPRSALLLASDGELYGTTSSGGQHDLGTIFAIQRTGGKYRLLRTFGGGAADGATPYASLTEGSDGKLYGTTVAGGSYGQGTVFSVAKNGQGYQILRSFSGLNDDGRNLYGPLVEGKDALLYGTTLNGGPHASGLIFRIGKDGRDYAPILFFSANGPEGRLPYGGVVLGEDEAFYGTTTAGAEARQGTVFKLGKASR